MTRDDVAFWFMVATLVAWWGALILRVVSLSLLP